MSSRAILLSLFTALLLNACQSVQQSSDKDTPLDYTNHETLQATLWIQHAAEYDALTRQAYRSAQQWLDPALQDSSWTAAIEQKTDYQDLPPAIILDVDETVLDNSPFQARMIQQNSGYDPKAWTDWVLESQADAIEGAVALTQAAASKGIQVFYVTNRDAQTEQATRQNLIDEGFPVDQQTDVVLLKDEQPEWTSDKTTRRSHIARNYRIIMLFGDDLNDFVSAKNITERRRNAFVQQYESKWGQAWFVLPNPIYGSWEGAMFDGQRPSTRPQSLQRKNQLLDDGDNR
ncbi:MAG: 5'-nucleotidase, lipoprotein e(P4) family [Bacteroidota bacterium]